MSTDRIFVKPAPGLLVRKPVGGHLPDQGEEVNLDSYWRRRLTDGDVTEVLPEPDKPAEKSAVKAKAATTAAATE